MHVCVYVWRMTLSMSKRKQNSWFVVRKYLLFSGKIDFYWGYKFYRGSCPICLIGTTTALPVNSVSVTPPTKQLCTTLGIWGAKSFFFHNLGGLSPKPLCRTATAELWYWNFINRQWPLATHCACTHDMSIRPIQAEVTNVFRSDRPGNWDVEMAYWRCLSGLVQQLRIVIWDIPLLSYMR